MHAFSKGDRFEVQLGARRRPSMQRVFFAQARDSVQFGQKSVRKAVGAASSSACDSVRFAQKPAVDSIPDGLIWVMDASPGFVEQARKFLHTALPVAILADLHADDYSLVFTRLVSSGSEELKKKVLPGTDISEYDLTGGLHQEGSRCIRVAEYIRNNLTGVEEKALKWQNAIIHEIGHRIVHFAGWKKAKLLQPDNKLSVAETGARLAEKGALNYYGITESGLFKAAYFRDFHHIPAAVRHGFLSHFTMPVNDPLPRQEAFAESFDILVRGKASDYNFGHFTRYFPNTLKVTADIVREVYPEFTVHPDVQAVFERQASSVLA